MPSLHFDTVLMKTEVLIVFFREAANFLVYLFEFLFGSHSPERIIGLCTMRPRGTYDIHFTGQCLGSLSTRAPLARAIFEDL